MKYFLLLIVLMSCKSKPIPLWEGKLFVGDSKSKSLVRKQSNEYISADSTIFDDYIAMSSDDFKTFYATYVLGCKEWKSGVKLSRRPYKNNKDAVKRVLGN